MVNGNKGKTKIVDETCESISDLDASATLASRIPSNFRKRNYQIAMALMEDGAKTSFRTSKINCTKQEMKYKRFRVHCSKNKKLMCSTSFHRSHKLKAVSII